MSRKNISLNLTIQQRAETLIKLRAFTGLSDLLSALIREEWERRHPPAIEPPQEVSPVAYLNDTPRKHRRK